MSKELLTLKAALKTPSTYLVASVNLIAILYSQHLIPDIYAPYVTSYLLFLGTYGIVGLVKFQAPRTPWDESQRDAFRNVHPEVQEKNK